MTEKLNNIEFEGEEISGLMVKVKRVVQIRGVDDIIRHFGVELREIDAEDVLGYAIDDLLNMLGLEYGYFVLKNGANYLMVKYGVMLNGWVLMMRDEVVCSGSREKCTGYWLDMMRITFTDRFMYGVQAVDVDEEVIRRSSKDKYDGLEVWRLVNCGN